MLLQQILSKTSQTLRHNIEVLSLPDAGTSSLPSTKKRVVLPILSSIFLATRSKSYKPSNDDRPVSGNQSNLCTPTSA
jgi:hypothetical protein